MARCTRSAWRTVLLALSLAQPFLVASSESRRLMQSTMPTGADLLLQMKQLRSKNRVLMAPVEQSLIEQYLEPKHSMLEWGSGFSTLWMSQFVASYYSIEHHKGWYDDMSGEVAKLPHVRYVLAHVPDGTKGWGGGVEEGSYEQFENYVKAVDQLQVKAFDRVLVDGRARTSCAEYVLKYLKPDSVVFIHDYMPRAYYHQVVHRYYTVIAASNEEQSLVVLRPKPEAIRAAQAGEIVPGASGRKHRY